MPTIPGASWKDDPIGFLVGEKFPLPPSAFFKAFGPGHPGRGHPPDDTPPSPQSAAGIQVEMEAYRAKLRALPREELDALVTAARAEAKDRLRLRFEEQERNLPYNQPHATNPDYVKWSKHAYWTVDEMVGLSLGRDPAIVRWADVQNEVRWSPFAVLYSERREIINRAVTMGQLWQETVPWVFLAWAERMQVEVPSSLMESVKALGLQIRDWKTVADELQTTVDRLQRELADSRAETIHNLKENRGFIEKMRADHKQLYDGMNDILRSRNVSIETLTAKIEALSAERSRPETFGQRERDSLLKLVLGMAVGGYGFQPKAGRSPAARTIADDLRLIGLSLDEDTIRKYLAEAKELLPDDPNGAG